MALPREKMIPVSLAVLAAAVVGYLILTTPDRRDAGTKIGDAINELPNGVDKAARQLEDRTPGEKLKDAVQDEKHDIKKAINRE